MMSRSEKRSGVNWILAGVLMGIINVILLMNGKILGASTAYVTATKDFLHAVFPGFTAGDAYFKTVPTGIWFELVLIVGVLFGARLSYVLRQRKNRQEGRVVESTPEPLPKKRYLWGFFGGLIFIFGARLAGGCTSGHILSGVAQIAPSSILFAIGVFASGYPVAKKLYGKGR